MKSITGPGGVHGFDGKSLERSLNPLGFTPDQAVLSQCDDGMAPAIGNSPRRLGRVALTGILAGEFLAGHNPIHLLRECACAFAKGSGIENSRARLGQLPIGFQALFRELKFMPVKEHDPALSDKIPDVAIPQVTGRRGFPMIDHRASPARLHQDHGKRCEHITTPNRAGINAFIAQFGEMPLTLNIAPQVPGKSGLATHPGHLNRGVGGWAAAHFLPLLSGGFFIRGGMMIHFQNKIPGGVPHAKHIKSGSRVLSHGKVGFMKKADKPSTMVQNSEKKEAEKSWSRGAVWLGRFVGIFIVPLVFLVLLEGCLRVVGLREPTDFFIKNKGRPGELTTNLKFGWQYFPPPISRWPRPQVIAKAKPATEKRVVVLGESAAFGTPSELYGFPHQLEILLDEKAEGLAGSDWNVINAAMTAINSHAIYQISKNLPQVDPDYVVLYIGNNEVIGPYAGGSVFGTASESLGTIRALISLRKTALGQLMTRAGDPDAENPRWQGLANFLDHQMTADDPRLAVIYEHFRRNLEDIIRKSHEAGARVVLCTVAVNLVDAPPFAGALPEDWDEAQIAQFEGLLEEASKTVLAGDYPSAEVLLADALLQAPSHALANYLMGLALSRNPETAGDAAEYFVKARDYDTLRFRADSRINQIIREVASRKLAEDDVFLDIAKTLAEHSSGPVALPGGEIFFEHVHFNFPGNFRVSLALAETLAIMDPTTTWPHPPMAEMDEEQFRSLKNETAYRVAWTPLQFVRLTDSLLQGLLRQPPFITRWNAQNYLEQKTDQWLAGREDLLTTERIVSSVQIARRSSQARPQDLYLRESLMIHAQQTEALPLAEEQARFLVEAIPTDYLSWTQLGTILLKQDRFEEAREAFQRALEINPYYHIASNNLQVARQRQDKANSP